MVLFNDDRLTTFKQQASDAILFVTENGHWRHGIKEEGNGHWRPRVDVRTTKSWRGESLTFGKKASGKTFPIDLNRVYPDLVIQFQLDHFNFDPDTDNFKILSQNGKFNCFLSPSRLSIMKTGCPLLTGLGSSLIYFVLSLVVDKQICANVVVPFEKVSLDSSGLIALANGILTSIGAGFHYYVKSRTQSCEEEAPFPNHGEGNKLSARADFLLLLPSHLPLMLQMSLFAVKTPKQLVLDYFVVLL
ncbi:hypothetical protein L596_021362 [Steinernema carpocapsae]|uniref:Uncharacterized protein n=1 Tax=Steinernema carpocapsae TaxID=34508 RepID=A0A4U5MIJ5_STECR|nr:hypothetical protein L596_021362 [Steinernema carpocapsae]